MSQMTCLCDEDARSDTCTKMNFNCTECVCCINRDKISENSFVAVTEDQLGISVDLVFSEDDALGWSDSRLISLSETNNEAAWNEAKSLAEELRAQLGIHSPIRFDSEHYT